MTKKKEKQDIIFSGDWTDSAMRVNSMSCGFNMPDALSGENNFGLPPYKKRNPFLVDKYPLCPENWMRSEGKVKSYFVPVEEGKGMWLDFNDNGNNANHVAIVISVQGINPITGLPCEDAQLEQYIEKCPKHKIKFGPDRYCKKCDYKWPKQNYLCTTGTPTGNLWLDGFKTAEGVVRQYILTAEKMKGVASNIIGKDRVFAIGISFFLSKEKKPVMLNHVLRGSWTTTTDNSSAKNYPLGLFKGEGSSGDAYDANVFYTSTADSMEIGGPVPTTGAAAAAAAVVVGDSLESAMGSTKGLIQTSSLSKSSSKSFSRSIKGDRRTSSTPVQTKKLEVGAGANIQQQIYNDPENLEFWHDEPEGIICINYCTEADARKIIEGGEVNLEGHEEGFLKDIPVGN